MENPWLKRYPPKVPADINPDEYRSLVEVFDRSCCQFGQRNAFVNMGYGMSYAELERMSRAFAAWLQQNLGLEKGERVAIVLPNLLQYPVALFGALRAGLVVVNINPVHTPRGGPAIAPPWTNGVSSTSWTARRQSRGGNCPERLWP